MNDVLAAIYARVSSEQQAEEHTIASQVAALRARVTDELLAKLRLKPTRKTRGLLPLGRQLRLAQSSTRFARCGLSGDALTPLP